jgi:diaminohydroxyphosphoribosylaminopyrimidine deaminase/5-amino-6-(5-phosphoribosylamino)uracil reductase
LNKATTYVSLEPCSHFGKTPPCCDLIIEHKIPNVVVGTVDPNEKVAGNGIKKLIASGANVVVGVLEKECNELNKRFFTFHQQKRPYIILKWAESQDGFLSPEKEVNQDRKPIWITNQYSRQLVHKWRSEEQAILVGTKTVIDDNPKLNVRDWSGNNPVRVVLDQNNRISKDSFVFDDSVKTIIFTKSEINFSAENTTFERIDFNENMIPQILSVLYQNQIQSIIIEGGLLTLQSFIDQNIWDEARIFVGKAIFKNGTKAPVLQKKNVTKTYIQNDELINVRNHD